MPTTAIVVSLLVQVPPEDEFVSVVPNPTQAFAIPLIAAGLLFTVIITNDLQPVGKEYVIVAVPAPIPVTTPVDETMLATVGWLLDHVPPETVLVIVAVAPIHRAELPEIAEGSGLTVIIFPLEQPVPKV
jgi:hypothetical protein